MVSWASLDDVNVRAGSILTIDKLTADEFDAIVFAEGQPNQWIAGSSGWKRTNPNLNPGFAEVETGQMVMIAISYEENGNNTRIKAYRNGDLIGSYQKGPLGQWPQGNAEIFWGLRHGSAGGGPGNLDAHIEESRIYSTVLDQNEIQNLSIPLANRVLSEFTVSFSRAVTVQPSNSTSETVSYSYTDEEQTVDFPGLGLHMDITGGKNLGDQLSSSRTFTVNPTLEVTPPSGSTDAESKVYTL